MKMIKYHKRIKNKNVNHRIPNDNHENHANHWIPFGNLENPESHEVPRDNNENHKNLWIS